MADPTTTATLATPATDPTVSEQMQARFQDEEQTTNLTAEQLYNSGTPWECTSAGGTVSFTLTFKKNAVEDVLYRNAEADNKAKSFLLWQLGANAWYSSASSEVADTLYLRGTVSKPKKRTDPVVAERLFIEHAQPIVVGAEDYVSVGTPTYQPDQTLRLVYSCVPQATESD